MRSKFFTPFFITLSTMGLFALVFSVSVDVYDALFWARFIFTLIALPLTCFGILCALKQPGFPPILRLMCIIAMYVVASFAILAFISAAALVTILCIILDAAFILFLILDHGIVKT